MKSILMITALFLATVLHSQTTLSVGEIFDFNINDEFHSSDIFPGQTPNAIRMKVVDKHFSPANDTVFYTRAFHNYHTVFNPDPEPHLEYFFHNYIDTVFYTNLSDSVVCDGSDTTCVSIFETTLCDVPANGWSVGGYLYGQSHAKIFGKGLGQVTDNYWEEGADNSYDIEMFYFKKDTMECGIPDSTITSIATNNLSSGIVNIYPNPFTGKFNIQFVDDQYPCKIRIFDSKGAEIFETTVTDCNNIVIDKVKNKGFYFLKNESEDKSYTKKIIKN
jgi:hypothetical protein